MKQIRKDYVLATLVRTFFKYFTTALIESDVEKGKTDTFEPRNVKQTMLQHYESVGQTFNKEVFYALMRMNYDAENMEQQLRQFTKEKQEKGESVSDMDLIRFACLNDEFFNAMADNYRQHFMMLLEGRIATDDDFQQMYQRNDNLGLMELTLAESIVNRMASAAYERGKELATKI